MASLARGAELIDYLDYENKVRKADSAYMQGIYRKYARQLKDCSSVLDIACGVGEFLLCARSEGINAIGIDDDQSIVDRARENGLAVEKADAFEYLERNPDRFDGIFCSQFVEHLPPERLDQFLKMANRSLKKGGTAIFVTPNPRSMVVHLQSFYKDFSHVRLYDLELLSFLAEGAGFKVIEAKADDDTVPKMLLMEPETTVAPPTNHDDHSKSERLFPCIERFKPVREKGTLNFIRYKINVAAFTLMEKQISGICDEIDANEKVVYDRMNANLANITAKQHADEITYNNFIRTIYEPHDIFIICTK